MKNCNKKIYALRLTVKYFHVSRQKGLKFWLIGLLQLAIHVVQNRRAGEQKSHWDKRLTKKITISNYVMSFVCLVPVRLLLSSVVVSYHVNG